MNILQCAKSLYDLVYPPKQGTAVPLRPPAPKREGSEGIDAYGVRCAYGANRRFPPLLRGTIMNIHSPDTITILAMEPIYAKTCVNIGGIITPNIHSFDADERDAAKYVVKQMKYRYWEKYAILDKNADVRCGDEYIWKWMVDNRLAVRENTPVPKNWKEYREVGFPTLVPS